MADVAVDVLKLGFKNISKDYFVVTTILKLMYNIYY